MTLTVLTVAGTLVFALLTVLADRHRWWRADRRRARHLLPHPWSQRNTRSRSSRPFVHRPVLPPITPNRDDPGLRHARKPIRPHKNKGEAPAPPQT